MKQLWSDLLHAVTTVSWFGIGSGYRYDALSRLAPLVVVALLSALVITWLGLSLIRRNRAPAGAIWIRRVAIGYWLLAPPLLATLYALDSQELLDRSVPPSDAMTIRVTAHKQEWRFLYPNDKQASNRLVVPFARPVRLFLTSSDQIRGFCLREYGVRSEAVIGRYSTVWFTPKQLGDVSIDCGSAAIFRNSSGHSQKGLGQTPRLSVLEPAAFDAWLKDPGIGGARP